ncbi:MAG: hypothetical protein LBJ12_05730 [Oscillospiraceae bacterium]|nr:hypothetical protein [Oscillospiraceae bacterium]
MKPINEIMNHNRLNILQSGHDGFRAAYIHPKVKLGTSYIIASWGGGWEHVSFSHAKRCPTWDEMCEIKDIFWCDEECVVQFHPPKSEYVNNFPYCLHLWKKIGGRFETPPSIFVGLK